MSNIDFNRSILENYNSFDTFLYRYKLNTELCDLLRSIRMSYSVHSVLSLQRKENKLRRLAGSLKQIIVKLFGLVLYKAILSNKSNIIFLYYTNKHNEIASNIGIECSHIQKQFSFRFKNFTLYFKIIKVIYILLKSKELNKYNVFVDIPKIIDSIFFYHDVDLSYIDVIITENDTHPIYVALISKAKRQGIKTVKIESVLINEIQQNNVYCEYYYYPSIFHKNIRSKFDFNKNLKYLKGGFLNWDVLVKYKHKPEKLPFIVSYFTAHSKLTGDFTDCFYIDEILSVLPTKFRLYIKIHPRENRELYKKYMHDKKCVVLPNDEDNYQLISKSTICISVFSSLSLEAKHIMKNSFFINYSPNSELNISKYSDFNDFFNTIISREELRDYLNFKKEAFPIPDFLKHFNMMYPNTCNSFKNVIKNLL